MEQKGVYVEQKDRAPIELARSPHTSRQLRHTLMLTRLRHIDANLCQRRPLPRKLPRGSPRVAEEANPPHHYYFLSNPRIASPLPIISAYLLFAKKNDEWCQAF